MPDLTVLPETSGAGAFKRFAQVAEEVGRTTKRLEKARLLAVYFSSLSNADLLLAARYLAGYAFPLRDQRTTNVGGSALLGAILAVSGCEETWLRERLVALGDLGEAAEEAFTAADLTGAEPDLSLSQIGVFFENLAQTAGAKAKQEVVIELLAKASPMEAKYLVKLCLGDLRIGLQEGAVEDAVARWSGQPVGLVQWANMLTGDIGETAILAHEGKLETAQMHLFHPIKFMLATAAADLAEVARQMPDEFVVEDKFDGIRAQAYISINAGEEDALHGVAYGSARVALFSRTLDEITKSFPDLVAPLAGLVTPDMPDLILDGEIVPVQGERILPFQILQKRLGRKSLTQEMLSSAPVAFIAYDVLYAGGRVRIDEPFFARRAVLDSLRVNGQSTRRADSRIFHDVAPLDEEFTAARERGNEGLMVKGPASPYKPGRRGRDWLKIKRALATLDVVVTAVEVGNGSRRHLLSDYTFAVRASEADPTLLNVGKAYSGLTDAELAALSEWFIAHTLQQFGHGKVRIVEPKIVIEVTFDKVQPSTRHKSGYALRFPRIVRVREDKPASEIDTLEAVKKLVEE